MKILYIGDIMGSVGVGVVEEVLPKLVKDEAVDLVIAQAENVSDGRGISSADYQHLKDIGVNFFSGGNWSIFNKEILPKLIDPEEPINSLANYPEREFGPGYKYVSVNGKTTMVVSLLGRIVGKDAAKEMLNPLKTIDEILSIEADTPKDAVVVNLHGDYSSEKVIIGHYLDGRVSLVVGDHWHVPTADERLLPKGTAHITDVGMCGELNASLGVSLESVIPRWRDGVQTRNQLASGGARQFNAVLVDVSSSNKSQSIKRVQIYL